MDPACDTEEYNLVSDCIIKRIYRR